MIEAAGDAHLRRYHASTSWPSALGLGCMAMSWSSAPCCQAGDDQVIRSAVERGVTFFGTAQVYGPSANETLLGEALATLRAQVVIATKLQRLEETSEQPTRGQFRAAPARCRRTSATTDS